MGYILAGDFDDNLMLLERPCRSQTIAIMMERRHDCHTVVQLASWTVSTSSLMTLQAQAFPAESSGTQHEAHDMRQAALPTLRGKRAVMMSDLSASRPNAFLGALVSGKGPSIRMQGPAVALLVKFIRFNFDSARSLASRRSTSYQVQNSQ